MVSYWESSLKWQDWQDFKLDRIQILEKVEWVKISVVDCSESDRNHKKGKYQSVSKKKKKKHLQGNKFSETSQSAFGKSDIESINSQDFDWRGIPERVSLEKTGCRVSKVKLPTITLRGWTAQTPSFVKGSIQARNAIHARERICVVNQQAVNIKYG
jgi:hypothetical protein